MKMNTSIIITSLILGFAMGAIFFPLLPAPTRELASQRDPGKDHLDAHLSSTFNQCLSDNVKDGKINFTKSEVDGHSWAIFSAECLGDKAKALYDAVGGFADEQYIHYSDGRRGIGRFFGSLYPPSQCVRLTRTARGNEMNLYSCSIRLDVSHEMVQGMK